MTIPYYVPGVPIGGERDDLESLELLVHDLRRYAAGHPPTEAEIASAPIVSRWIAVPDLSSSRLVGLVDAHPRVGPGPGATSRICAMDHERRWMRSYSRLWRLGPSAPSDRRGKL